MSNQRHPWAVADHFVPAQLHSERGVLLRARITVCLCLLSVGISIVVQGVRVQLEAQHWLPMASWLLASLMFLLAPFALRATHSVNVAATLASLAGLVGALGVAAFEGGLSSPNALVLLVLPVSAGMMGRVPGLVTGASCCATVVGLYYLGEAGLLPRGAELPQSQLQVMRAAMMVALAAMLTFAGFVYEWERRANERRLESKAQELADARDRALAAAGAKAEFLANMSHEIRTPLNGVIGMTELMMRSKLSREDRRSLNTIRNSGQALLGVINDILDLSKLEVGQLELDSQPMSLRDTIEEVLTLFGAEAGAKGLELNLRMAQDCPRWVKGDAPRLRQVLINLVGNAMKFTDHGEVLVTVSGNAAGRLHVAVKDTGIGIDEDDRKRLFEAFTQADASTTRKYGGTGLGLTISRQLVGLMGGKLWVQSKLGEGSVFHFTLQLPTTQANEPPPPLSLQHKNILLVEAHPTTSDVALSLLHAARCHVTLVATKAEALAAVDAQPDLDALVLSTSVQELGFLEDALVDAAPHLPRVLLRTPPEAEERPLDEASPYAADLLKPIRRAALWDAVHACFAQPLHTGFHNSSPFDPNLAERRPLSILVAEDTPTNQEVIRAMLEGFGYDADIVNNGREALDAIDERDYDVLLLDMHMPEMDGLETARRLHDQQRDSMPHLVAFTANVLPEHRRAYEAAGVEDFIPKPVEVQTLRSTLERVADNDQGVRGAEKRVS